MTGEHPQRDEPTPESVRTRVTSLYHVYHGSTGDAQIRLRWHSEIEELRALYRRNSLLFPPDLVAMLKEISLSLVSVGPRVTAEEVLKSSFGYSAFRPGQKPIIDAVVAGQDCVGIMPTGAGKSLTYQLPARLLGGTTLVISPLIALMKDQVDAMAAVGLRATFLNSSLSFEQRRERVARLRAGEYELVYAAPEGIEASVGHVLEGVGLSLIAVDEAHCISHWGHDFRPAYRNLTGLKQRFGRIPVLALTATATPEVARDIVEQLKMKNAAVYRGSFFRPNLKLCAYEKGAALGASVGQAIARLIGARAGESGIVYCLSRKTTEQTAELLRKNGIRADAYHAGLEAAERTRVQDAFQDGTTDVVVATIAFGMGIDKANVRYVIHRDMPRSLEGYYQEVGRAGRDGLPSDCVLFYSWADVKSYDRFAEDAPETQAPRLRGQTRQMFHFGEGKSCRHQRLVAHFGETIAACGASCDRCNAADLLASTAERAVVAQKRSRRADTAANELTEIDRELFEKLRGLRRELAKEQDVPAFVVFSDATLLEMAARRPQTETELGRVSGVGPTKLARYGGVFLKLLRA
jgi:ATP-dependent DNA helicase RecQ